MNKILYKAGVFIFIFAMIFSCGEKNHDKSVDDQEEILKPTLHSEDVTTLISDSGVTKYRITTKVWEVYDKTASPYWYFPEKIFVEKFDSIYQTEASIKGDTAYFYSNEKLWHIIGNVVVINQKQEKFSTEELFWDQKSQKIYSDKFIHIETPVRIIEGYGFESDESMNRYRILKTNAIFDVKDDSPEVKSDVESDSVEGK